MLAFAAALFFLLITPGPGVLSLAGVGSAFGTSHGVRYLAGLWLGNNLVGVFVVSGLAATLLATPVIRDVLLWASIAYLAYLAFRIAFAGSKIAFIERQRPPGIAGGLALQIINPKAYAVHTALFTGFAIWPDDLLFETLIKFAIMNAVWIPIHFLWLWAGITLHRLDLPKPVQFRINIAMAVSMLMVVALAAWAPH